MRDRTHTASSWSPPIYQLPTIQADKGLVSWQPSCWSNIFGAPRTPEPDLGLLMLFPLQVPLLILLHCYWYNYTVLLVLELLLLLLKIFSVMPQSLFLLVLAMLATSLFIYLNKYQYFYIINLTSCPSKWLFHSLPLHLSSSYQHSRSVGKETLCIREPQRFSTRGAGRDAETDAWKSVLSLRRQKLTFRTLSDSSDVKSRRLWRWGVIAHPERSHWILIPLTAL